ncbi:hypothetical protein IFR05_015421 [Cadophora sp. M221]|nr:hypothetical protein IFR05_015421 [Cadophora sp. M221]
MKTIIPTLIYLSTYFFALSIIINISASVSAAPAHGYRHVHQLNNNQNHNHRYGSRNYTIGTVVVQIVAQEQNGQPEVEDQELGTGRENEDEDGNENERIEIRTAYTLTPHIVIVQRMVDRVAEAVRERGGEIGEVENDEEMREEDDAERDFLDDEPPTVPDRKVVGEQVTTLNNIRTVRTELISEEVVGTQRDGGGDTEDEREREAERDQSEREDEKRRGNVQTNGPNEEGEGVAVLMGWTALVGVVGILAIAPAG